MQVVCMGTTPTVLEIVNSKTRADALKRIEISDVETLKELILYEGNHQALKIRALMKLYSQLLEGSYTNQVAQLLFLCYTTDNAQLRINIIRFLDHPTVLHYLLQKERNPEVFDMIAERLVHIWSKFLIA